jgi:type I restriction enzyme S subunit
VNYPVVELGDICDEIYRYPSFYGMEHFSTGVPVIRGEHIDAWGNISQDWSDYWFVSKEVSNQFPRTVLREGDLIFTVRGTIGKVGLITKSHDGAQLSPNLIRFSPKREVVDTIFLWYFLQSIKETAAADIQNEVTIASVRASDLSELKIPLPPLTEQKRIASLLARADRLRQLRRTAHDLGDALLQSVFLEMFGDPETNEKGWDKLPFDDVCTIDAEMVDPREEKYLDLPHIGGANIESVTGNLFDLKSAREDGLISSKFLVHPNNILFSKIRPKLRKVAFPKIHAVCSADIYPLSVNTENCNIFYLLHYLRSDFYSKKVSELAETRTNIPKVNRDELSEQFIPVPPLSLQEEFAGVVARVESLRGRMGESTRQVEGLFESLLAQSFQE